MTTISSLLSFIMDGSNNPLIIFAKFLGVLPLSFNFHKLRVKILVIGYDLILFTLCIIDHRYRLHTASDVGSKISKVTTISLKFRTVISFVMLSTLIAGNFQKGKKMQIVVEEMKKFDKNVSFLCLFLTRSLVSRKFINNFRFNF